MYCKNLAANVVIIFHLQNMFKIVLVRYNNLLEFKTA